MRLLRWSVNYDEDWEVCHRCPEKGRMRAICRQQHWERDHFPHLPRQPQQHADHSEVNTFDPSEQLPKCLWCFQPCTWETGQRISCRFCEQGPFHAVCWMRHYNTTHNHFDQPGAEMPIMEEQQPPCHTQSQLHSGGLTWKTRWSPTSVPGTTGGSCSTAAWTTTPGVCWNLRRSSGTRN